MIARIKIRGFEVASGWEEKGVRLPEQGTLHAAGYDFFAPYDIEIPSLPCSTRPTMVATGIKAYMRAGEYLQLANRSSNPKKGLLLANGVGVVDSDYYENEDNDGHILFAYWNISTEPAFFKKGDRIGQGIFLPYLSADDSVRGAKRKGGFGSTDDWQEVAA